MKNIDPLVCLLFCIIALILAFDEEYETSLVFLCIGMSFVSSSSTKTNNNLIEKKSELGTFFVRLEKVDEDKKNVLIRAIRDFMGFTLPQAKDKVDAVRLGSMSIISENISKESAQRLMEIINMSGGIAVVVDNKPIF